VKNQVKTGFGCAFGCAATCLGLYLILNVASFA